MAEGSQSFVSVDGVVFTKDMTTLIAYPPVKKGEAYVVPDGVETIVVDAFVGASELKRVTHDGVSYTVTAADPGTFAGAADLDESSVLLSAGQIGTEAFDEGVTVTGRDTMTDFIVDRRILSYGDTLAVSPSPLLWQREQL